jgi:hypothetical protein
MKSKILAINDTTKSELVHKTVTKISNLLDDATGIIGGMKSLAKSLKEDDLSEEDRKWRLNSLNLSMDLLNIVDKASNSMVENSPVRDELIRLKEDTLSNNANLSGLQNIKNNPNKIIAASTSDLGLYGLDFTSQEGLEDALNKFDKANDVINEQKKFIKAMSREEEKTFSNSEQSYETIESKLSDLKKDLLKNPYKISRIQASLDSGVVLKLLT